MKKHEPLVTRCILADCAAIIPEHRVIRRSNTCSKECAKRLRAAHRRMTDLRRCRSCNKPSTPEERAMFTKWRRQQPGEGRRKRGFPKGRKRTPAGTLQPVTPAAAAEENL